MNQYNKPQIEKQMFQLLAAFIKTERAANIAAASICEQYIQPVLNSLLDRNKLLMEMQVKVDACEQQRLACLEYITTTDKEIAGLRATIVNRDKEIELYLQAIDKLRDVLDKIHAADLYGKTQSGVNSLQVRVQVDIDMATNFIKEAQKLR